MLIMRGYVDSYGWKGDVYLSSRESSRTESTSCVPLNGVAWQVVQLVLSPMPIGERLICLYLSRFGLVLDCDA